jgi:RNA polymerase sigma-70 factor (ECF subfamily)
MDSEASNPRDRELVANLGWVQRLALSLARDRDAADDLAQDVARVWLEKRPALADGPRGWLAAVARKLALDRARSEISRRTRERSAALPEGEGFEVVERGARQRRVVEAVLQLAEPYRSTILYRYLDDLSTREVAERMNTNEATVRKRIERGLALLRERFEREFGSRANAWAIALLEPGLHGAILKGAGIMSLKWIAAAGAVVLLAGGAWYLRERMTPELGLEVGGKGVVVPLEVAAAREKQMAPPARELESAEEVPRTTLAAEPSPAPGATRLHGYVFVDEVRQAPADLKIVRPADKSRPSANARVDTQSGTWSLSPLEGNPGRLWITSDSTVPAQIPIPPDLWEKGGEFDLHLSRGRTLILTFLDKETKQPLPNLEFVLTNGIETERSRGRVSTISEDFLHKTDVQGKAVLTGIPLAGDISVTVDASKRERDMVLQDGKTMQARLAREPDWQAWLKKEQPARLEQTILVSLPLGEACASGQVPAWAVQLAGGLDSVRVIARETTNESPQARGMPFRLKLDEHGGFELCVDAPSRHAVWIENTQSRERLSAETVLDVTRPGAQDPITFHELDGKKITLRFVHVPERGMLQAWTIGKDGTNLNFSTACQGADFTRELTLSSDEQVQLSLHLGADPNEKSAWARRVGVDAEREITVDLGGCERTLRIESNELGALPGDGSISLMRIENGEAGFEQWIVVPCNAGRGSTPVHVPNGRWLYRYDDKDQVAVWGLVDVATAAQPGEELVLRPRLRLVPLAEIQPGIRFDEIEGISLAKLPEKFRTASAKGGSERVALPLDAKYVTLEGK